MAPEKRTPLSSALATVALLALVAMTVVSAHPEFSPSPYWGLILLVVYLVSMGYGALVQAVAEARYD